MKNSQFHLTSQKLSWILLNGGNKLGGAKRKKKSVAINNDRVIQSYLYLSTFGKRGHGSKKGGIHERGKLEY